MRARSALSAFAAVALLPLITAGTAAAAPAATTAQCSPISISYVFDNDQTGGWWVVTTSMKCSPASYFKRYDLQIYDRPLTKHFASENTGYRTDPYDNRTIVPATAASQKKSACVSATSELYYFDKTLIDSESRNACFKTAAP
ncbi:hypothetical protein EV138_7468 [Kribbella voronezhensis]|uniref:Peptidase inhibitor family I36 n=1 Tax=Kribbella voronezhensis TaxID=2512212 RepID=A0A4V3FII9_9ACTN|nr:hypothetical protein [Kribbella voronezhensis]TDU82573.1 hypothetical protein EV138_7468 [Kribbella voronezhensis]